MRDAFVALFILCALPATALGQAVRLPGGEEARVIDHHLELRRGKAKATLPLPLDVTDIAGASGTTTVRILLERLCPPQRVLELTGAEIDARFAFGAAKSVAAQHREAAIQLLQGALLKAPRQTDLRIALARLQLPQKAAALETLRAGLGERPLETFYYALQDPKLRALVSDLGLPTKPAGLLEGADPVVRHGVWSPGRSWFAFADSLDLYVVDVDGRELLSAPLAAYRDVDDEGVALPEARARVKRHRADIDRLLGAFEFRAFDAKGRAQIEDDSFEQALSWLRWKDRDLVASAGGSLIRVRRTGKVIFERKIDIMGTIRFDWGQYVDGPMLVLAWSRRSGSDDCPNGNGLQIVKLPPP